MTPNMYPMQGLVGFGSVPPRTRPGVGRVHVRTKNGNPIYQIPTVASGECYWRSDKFNWWPDRARSSNAIYLRVGRYRKRDIQSRCDRNWKWRWQYIYDNRSTTIHSNSSLQNRGSGRADAIRRNGGIYCGTPNSICAVAVPAEIDRKAKANNSRCICKVPGFLRTSDARRQYGCDEWSYFNIAQRLGKRPRLNRGTPCCPSSVFADGLFCAWGR
jgi:hypothetical protein